MGSGPPYAATNPPSSSGPASSGDTPPSLTDPLLDELLLSAPLLDELLFDEPPPEPPFVPVDTSELHAVTASDAPKTNAAARLMRAVAAGIARSAKSAGSAAAQKGHDASPTRMCLWQEGQAASGWYIIATSPERILLKEEEAALHKAALRHRRPLRPAEEARRNPQSRRRHRGALRRRAAGLRKATSRRRRPRARRHPAARPRRRLNRCSRSCCSPTRCLTSCCSTTLRPIRRSLLPTAPPSCTPSPRAKRRTRTPPLGSSACLRPESRALRNPSEAPRSRTDRSAPEPGRASDKKDKQQAVGTSITPAPHSTRNARAKGSASLAPRAEVLLSSPHALVSLVPSLRPLALPGANREP